MGIVDRLMNRLTPNQNGLLFVVTSNCQTHGIASSLNLMVPNSKSIPIWTLSGLQYIIQEINSKVDGNFVWLTTLSVEQQEEVVRKLKYKPVIAVQIPEIFFDAFHPDMTYVQLNDGTLLESALGHYHSKISLWCYLNNVSLDDTLKFFSGETYIRLGYLGRHKNSLLGLKSAIANCELDTSPFGDVINHADSFMHTFNHPKLSILAAVAESVCVKMQITPAIRHSEIPQVLRDVLYEAGPIFPIYPEIADFYGLEGTYLSRRQDGRILSLDEFNEESFLIYADVPFDQFNRESLFTEFFDKQMLEMMKI